MTEPAIATFFSDLWHYEFWRRAIIGGLLISIACSLLSVYVVLKRMAFIGQGISHSAFGGIALGALMFAGSAGADAKIYAVTLLFCLAIAFMIAATTRLSRISEDSAIGIFFVVSMAFGVICINSTKGYNKDVSSYLFGSILALSQTDMYIMAAVAAVVVGVVWTFYKELLYYTFDENMAAISGVPVRLLHYLMLGGLSLTIVISVKLVGVILISAFLILPGAIAQLLSERFDRLMLYAVAVGICTTLAGVFTSHLTNWPTGATIVIVQFAAFVLMFSIRKLQGTLTA